jgi:hypothetical protein
MLLSLLVFLSFTAEARELDNSSLRRLLDVNEPVDAHHYVKNLARTGDLIFNASDKYSSRAIRTITRSDVSHVAVVVVRDGKKHLLEASGVDGVNLYDLKVRLSQLVYDRENGKIWVRQISEGLSKSIQEMVDGIPSGRCSGCKKPFATRDEWETHKNSYYSWSWFYSCGRSSYITGHCLAHNPCENATDNAHCRHWATWFTDAEKKSLDLLLDCKNSEGVPFTYVCVPAFVWSKMWFTDEGASVAWDRKQAYAKETGYFCSEIVVEFFRRTGVLSYAARLKAEEVSPSDLDQTRPLRKRTGTLLELGKRRPITIGD